MFGVYHDEKVVLEFVQIVAIDAIPN